MPPFAVAFHFFGIITALMVTIFEGLFGLVDGINKDTTVTLAIAFAGITLAAGLSWRVSRYFSDTDHRIKSLEQRLKVVDKWHPPKDSDDE